MRTLPGAVTRLILPCFTHFDAKNASWCQATAGASKSRNETKRRMTPKFTSWNTNYQYRLDKLHLQTLYMRTSYLKQCHLYKLIHGLSIFPNSPITTFSSSLPLTIIFLYMYPPPTQMLIITLFCDAIRTWKSLYLTLLCHYLALIYLKRIGSLYSYYIGHDAPNLQ